MFFLVTLMKNKWQFEKKKHRENSGNFFNHVGRHPGIVVRNYADHTVINV